MIETGKTITIRDESNWMVASVMYKIFQQIGVEAVLADQEELRDTDQYFIKRLELPVPLVLSNVYPKDTQSPFAKLRQSYSKTLPNGARVFFINLMNPDNFQGQTVIGKNYDVLQPLEFLSKFNSQISSRDILVARLNLNTAQIGDLFKAPESNRIDLIIMPTGEARQFLTPTESALIQNTSGWSGKESPPAQTTPPIAPQPSPQRPNELVGPPQAPDTTVNPGANETKGDSKSAQGASGNQGGEKVEDTGGTNPETGSTTTPGTTPGSKTPGTTEPTPPVPVTQPAPANPLPAPNIDLKIEDRQFMDITNEHHIVPEEQSAEYLREIEYRRKGSGSRMIKVSDIIMYENVPHDPEIKKLADDTDVQQQELRMKTVTLRVAKNYAEGQRNYQQNQNPYVGPEACKECHPIAYNVWKSSAHAKALDALKKKSATKNETCLKCHVTPWEPPAGWSSWEYAKFAPELGCEACHGLGASHINLINYMIEKDRRKYWDEVKREYPYLGLKGSLSKNDCIKCHDKANSPNFDFVKYWDKIIHTEPPITELPQPKVETTPATGNMITQTPQGSLTPGAIAPPSQKGGKEKPGEKKPDKKKPETKKPESGKTGSKDSGTKKPK